MLLWSFAHHSRAFLGALLAAPELVSPHPSPNPSPNPNPNQVDSGAGRSILIAKHCQSAELGARPEGDSYLGSHSDPEATRDAEPTLGGGGGTAAAALAARSRPVLTPTLTLTLTLTLALTLALTLTLTQVAVLPPRPGHVPDVRPCRGLPTGVP